MKARIEAGRASVGEMATNIAALFGAESHEAFAGAYAFAEHITFYRKLHTKR